MRFASSDKNYNNLDPSFKILRRVAVKISVSHFGEVLFREGTGMKI